MEVNTGSRTGLWQIDRKVLTFAQRANPEGKKQGRAKDLGEGWRESWEKERRGWQAHGIHPGSRGPLLHKCMRVCVFACVYECEEETSFKTAVFLTNAHSHTPRALLILSLPATPWSKNSHSTLLQEAATILNQSTRSVKGIGIHQPLGVCVRARALVFTRSGATRGTPDWR